MIHNFSFVLSLGLLLIQTMFWSHHYLMTMGSTAYQEPHVCPWADPLNWPNANCSWPRLDRFSGTQVNIRCLLEGEIQLEGADQCL